MSTHLLVSKNITDALLDHISGSSSPAFFKLSGKPAPLPLSMLPASINIQRGFFLPLDVKFPFSHHGW